MIGSIQRPGARDVTSGVKQTTRETVRTHSLRIFQAISFRVGKKMVGTLFDNM